MFHGIGIGFATSQLTNVVLSDIPPQKAGSASGAAGMVRQVGTALGIALIGAIFVSQAHQPRAPRPRAGEATFRPRCASRW